MSHHQSKSGGSQPSGPAKNRRAVVVGDDSVSKLGSAHDGVQNTDGNRGEWRSQKLISAQNTGGLNRISMAGRWSGGAVLGGVATIVLFTLMMVLIRDEFEPQDKVETANFEINPVVEDVVPDITLTEIKPFQKVETPPPPPRIEQAEAELPTVKIVEVTSGIRDFKRPDINPDTLTITVPDTDAQPIVRVPPIMPNRASRSGHCRVEFDVSPAGQPFNIQATSCSQSLFRGPTVKSVERWTYNPKIVSGKAVARSGVRSVVRFNLTDERGQIIPE